MSYMMTVKEVSEALKISEQTVRRHYKLHCIGRSVRIRRSDVFGDKSNPLFRGEGTPALLGELFQWQNGSPHNPGSDAWRDFGLKLVDAFREHLIETDQYDTITTLEAALAWSKTSEGQNFFDQHIPSPGRQHRFAFYAK